jgi:hypothetical protein
MAVLVAMVAGTAWGRNIEVPMDGRVSVCVQSVPSNEWTSLVMAEGIAIHMFAGAGVALDWREWNHCPEGGIRITMSLAAKPSDHPHAYAYALPYEGTHIVVFWDRIDNGSSRRILPYLLAHVLVHEVTHILQGMPRHSETGVMKAVFRPLEIDQMDFKPLPFTEEDVELIHVGLKNREARMAQGPAQVVAQNTDKTMATAVAGTAR